MALRQAASLATMPAVAPPLATSASTSRNVMSAIVDPSRSSTPAVAPAMMSRGDFSRPARCAASVSAFTLNSSPSRDAPMLDTTGT